MAIREIRLEGDEILSKVSREVTKIDDRILGILDDMVETMYAAEGVGLAAVQVGILRRLVVIDIGEGPIKMINPRFVSKEGCVISREGCLSVPDVNGMVKRPKKVVVEYTDVEGNLQTIEAEGFLKKALCHELDHLEGIVYTDVAEVVFPMEDIEKYEELYDVKPVKKGTPHFDNEADWSEE
ncbi:MAG: peptide deformylase [Anaerofustis stercorihominis]|nr:peptide deformylase [Anaerofustis stercorihominis]